MPNKMPANLGVWLLPPAQRLCRRRQPSRRAEIVQEPVWIQAQEILSIEVPSVAKRPIEKLHLVEAESAPLSRGPWVEQPSANPSPRFSMQPVGCSTAKRRRMFDTSGRSLEYMARSALGLLIAPFYPTASRANQGANELLASIRAISIHRYRMECKWAPSLFSIPDRFSRRGAASSSRPSDPSRSPK